MKEHRQLLNTYQEASWALAMEQLALHQGKEAEVLEEQLRNDPQAAVPQDIVDHCQDFIRRKFSTPPTRRLKSVFSKVLIAAVLCFLTTSVACAFSPSFKDFLIRAFYSIAETFTSITFQNPQSANSVESQEPVRIEYHGLQFEWLPEGYEYVDGAETPSCKMVDFENAQSDLIRVRVANTDDFTAYNYDHEFDDVINVTIGEFSGQITETQDGSTLVWVDPQRMKSISMYTTNLPQDKLLQLARGVRY